MNTLLIAPDSDLINIPEETRSIQEAINAQIINGRVTPRIVADAISNRIARRKTIDILFFIGHGSLTGLQLTEVYITIAELCRYVKSAGIRYLILNTCDSEYIALAIHHETGATVICTVAQVNDNEAYATSRLLAEAIANGDSVEEAYERARPSGAGQSTYRIFSSKQDDEGNIDDDTTTPDPTTTRLVRAMLDRQFRKFESGLNELKTVITEEQQRREAQIAIQGKDIAAIMQDVSELKKNQPQQTIILPDNYKLVFAGIYVTLFIPVAVFFYEFRQILEINNLVAYGIALIFYTISFALASYFYGFMGNRRAK